MLSRESDSLPIDFLLLSVDKSGEDGIRTHVPVKANGFQDRLVMTASIPLQYIRLSLTQVLSYQKVIPMSTIFSKNKSKNIIL